MGRVLGIENRKYWSLFWYRYRNGRILIEFPILKTILWNSYVCNLNYNVRILGLEYKYITSRNLFEYIVFKTFIFFISFFSIRTFFLFCYNKTNYVPCECIINKSILFKKYLFLKLASGSKYRMYRNLYWNGNKIWYGPITSDYQVFCSTN